MDGDALGTKLFIAKSSDSASDLELPFRTQCGSPEWENGRCRIFRADARYTGKSYFRAYAEELLDEVFDMVHENVPIDFVNGLCGIGWGIEYLLCHSLMDGDADEVLEDIDKKIVERDPLYVRDLSLHTGVQGIHSDVCCRPFVPCPYERLPAFPFRIPRTFAKTLGRHFSF